uniref:nectin-4 isoform X3 n=1 Tax=Gasterosteus aculeatus aculeatus TaxID=481459 RepID=UPI001A9905CE|nr:nectin-4 isoform X3 [Gasterosteus aculeatus aculeatus]
METKGHRLAVLLLLAACAQADFEEPPQPVSSLRSFAEGETRLPCRYRAEGEEKVVQVTWYKELPDGSKDQIITAHFTDGQTEFGRYSGRVRFQSGTPTVDSTLLIPSTEDSDQGSYTCHISTFPNGNFERQMTLTVWVLPISSLDPVLLVEGQSFRVAASCRAVGRPAPRLSWDTDLPGQSQNRSKEGGSVSSYYSLHPLRGMNGKKLDCLVWHPGLQQPRRIPNRLVVQYPPDATISAETRDWVVGLERAELLCGSGGQPKPQSVTWTRRRGGALPDGASAIGGKLVFVRALRLNDSGVYECLVRNDVGEGRTEYTLTVKETSRQEVSVNNMLLIIIGASAGALVLVLVLIVLLVNRHHRNKNKKLELELSEKTEEIQSFSRQASFRRLNSVSTDPRLHPEDYAVLRVDSRMKSSQMSLERPASTVSGRWGPPAGVEVDELGRPVVWRVGGDGTRGAGRDGEEVEERRRRVESFLKDSNMSLARQDDGVGPREPHLGHLTEVEDWGPAQPVAEGHGDAGDKDDDEEEEEDDSGSYQLSKALNNHFYSSGGFLRPKPHSNAILLHPRGQII